MKAAPPDAAAHAEGTRAYKAWKGSNKFFFDGRFIFGPDARSAFLTIFLIVAPISIFCIYVARKLMDDFSYHWGISIMVFAIAFTIYDLSLLLLTSGRDPGIVPRNSHPPEPDNLGSVEIAGVQTPQLRLPRIKDVVVNGITVKIKYCDTCMLYRPPRCSHCSICNNCVQRFDHHCPWVGQCIGLRNYRYFFMFIFSTFLLCIYVFAFCWVYVKRIKDAEQTTVWRAMAKTPASVVLIVYTFISMWFVGGLSVFHFYLMSTNQTTYENFRYRYDRRANPYNRGLVENFVEIFFTSIPPSKNKFRARIPREQGLQTVSMVGPVVGPSMEEAGDLEMGRKPVVWGGEAGDEAGLEDLEVGLGSDVLDGKDDGSTRAHPSEGLEGLATMHPRRSSWGRKSGNWEMPPEVLALAAGAGGSNRSTDGSGIGSTNAGNQ